MTIGFFYDSTWGTRSHWKFKQDQTGKTEQWCVVWVLFPGKKLIMGGRADVQKATLD